MLPLTVEAVVNGEPVQTEHLEINQRSLMPVWVFSLALVLITGFGGLLLALNGGAGGDDSTPTATSQPVGAAGSPASTPTVAIVAAAPTTSPLATPSVSSAPTATLPPAVVSPQPTALVSATPA